MKNLKKITVAILVVAVLVAVAVTTALAASGDSGSYTGTVEQARSLLSQVDSLGTGKEKSEKLIELYGYLATVDPDAEGYDGLIGEYETKSINVGQLLLSELSSSEGSSYEERAAISASLYAHLTKAPVSDDDATVYSQYVVLCKNYSTRTLKIYNDYVGEIKATESLEARSSAICSLYGYIEKAPILDKDVSGYTDCLVAYNSVTVDIWFDFIESDSSAAGMKKVYVHQLKSPSLLDDLDGAELEAIEGKIAEYEALFDKKCTENAAELLKKVDLNATPALTRSELQARLADVYTFINDDVKIYDETAEAYVTFLKDYNGKIYAVAKLYYAEVEKLVVAGPAPEGQTPVTPAFIASVEDFVSFLAECPSLIYRPAEPGEATGTLDKAKELLSAVMPEGVTEPKLDEYSKLFAYMTLTPVSPEAEGAKAFYADYSALTAKVCECLSGKIKALNSSPKCQDGVTLDKEEFSKQLQNVKDIASFLKSTPVSLKVINEYNEALNGFTVTLKKNFDEEYSVFKTAKKDLDDYLAKYKVDAEQLPENSGYDKFAEDVAALDKYVAVSSIFDSLYNSSFDSFGAKIPSVDENRKDLADAVNSLMSADLLVYKELETSTNYTGDVAVVQSMLTDFMNETEPEVKAQIYADIYKYLKETPVNPKVDGYNIFYAAFIVSANDVYSYLTDKMNTAKPNELITTLEWVRGYLEATPVSELAVNAYNVKFLVGYSERLNLSLSAYESATKKLHGILSDLEEAGNLPEIEGLEAAIDNYEVLELNGMVQAYNMSYLKDEPDRGYIAVSARNAALAKMNSYISNYSIDENAVGYAALLVEVDEASLDYQKVYNEARNTIDSLTSLEEYGYNDYFYEENWDSGKSAISFYHEDFSKGTYSEIVEDESGSGYYWKLNHSSTLTSPYYGVSYMDSTKGLVMEFKIKSFGDTNGIYFSKIETDENKNRPRNPFFKFENNNFIKAINGVYEESGKEVLTPGEWSHCIFIYNPQGPTMSAYINYEYMGEWSVAAQVPQYTELRVQSLGGNFEIAFDDFRLYQGTNFRILDKFDNMTNEEQFRFYVDYMYNVDNKASARLLAYNKATLLYQEFAENENLKDYIERYETLDLNEEIIGPAKKANLAALKLIADKLSIYAEAGALTSENKLEAQAIIDQINSFIEANSEYLDAGEEFNAIDALVKQMQSKIDLFGTLGSFIKSLELFDRATTYASRVKHYDAATRYYELGEFDVESVRASFAQDLALIAFETKYGVGIFEYYGKCDVAIREYKLIENTERIIDCVGFITEMEGYEDTEEFWANNFDYINNYMLIVRSVLKSGEYDPEHEAEALDAAIASFNVIDEYFYNILQEEHIAVIEEQLLKYPNTSSYIEKLGICAFVSNYIAANDIDLTNEKLASLIVINSTYESELASYKEEYDKILEQNTVSFIALVNKMNSYVDYKDLAPLYNEALKYYYELNVESDEAKAAVAAFDKYIDKIEEIEIASAMFIGYVEDLDGARSVGARYKALVNCSKYVDFVSASIDGVEDALETYESELQEYNDKYLGLNSEISEMNSVACSVRANAIAETILAVIDKIFNR